MSREWRTFEARSRFPEIPTRLPSKYERLAPQWDRSPASFQAFLDEYSELCDELGIFDNDEKKITSLLRYAPNSDVRYMWKMLSTDPRVRVDWNVYRNILVENTPGAEEELRYTKADLNDLVHVFQSKPLQTLTDLNSYWERFFVVSEFLRANGRLSEGQQCDTFLKGLPESLRRRVQAQIRTEYPTKYPEDPLPLRDAFRITCFVLSAHGFYIDNIKPHSCSSGHSETSVPVNVTPNQTRIVNVAPRENRAANRIPSAIVTPESTSTLIQAVSSFKASMEALSTSLGMNTNGTVVSTVPQAPNRSRNDPSHRRSPERSDRLAARSEPSCSLQAQDTLERIKHGHRPHPIHIAQNNAYDYDPTNVENSTKDVSTRSEPRSRPLSVPASLPNSSPQHGVDVHVNEIFSTATNSSDNDFDKEISLLEIMVQQARSKLKVARSKAELFSKPQHTKNEPRKHHWGAVLCIKPW